jgi:hypothetical protein
MHWYPRIVSMGLKSVSRGERRLEAVVARILPSLKRRFILISRLSFMIEKSHRFYTYGPVAYILDNRKPDLS